MVFEKKRTVFEKPKQKRKRKKYTLGDREGGVGGGKEPQTHTPYGTGFDQGARWIKRSFARYVQDESALIRYVLPDTGFGRWEIRQR